jgi:hypothetical protein
LLDGWQQTLLDNLDDPIIQANLDLLKASARELIKKFVASKKLADPVTPDFVSAVSGSPVRAGEDRRQRRRHQEGAAARRLTGHAGRPAQAVRRNQRDFLNDRCKGKDASKLRFVVE